MTYNLNRLQRLDPETPFLVTLNPSRPPSRVHDRAYLGFGFHEDGFRSAVEAAEPLGGRLE